jgi:hypothetical protein
MNLGPAPLSILVFTAVCGIGCGRYRQHVYRDRLIGHYAAYSRDQKRPPSGDTLEINENGTCLHTYIKSGDKERTEQSCAWTLSDKADGTWLQFEGLSDGVHRPCTGTCVVEAAAWDGEFVTRFEMPSSPDFIYAK